MSTHLFPDRQSSDAPSPSPIPSCLIAGIPSLSPHLAFCNWERGEKEGGKKAVRERGRKQIQGTGWQEDNELSRGGWQPGTRGRCQGLLGCGHVRAVSNVRASVCRGRRHAELPRLAAGLPVS